MTNWRTVKKDKPCPICKKPDWCGVSEDGTAVHCMRVHSQKETDNGGWIHKLSDPVPAYSIPEKKPEEKRIDFQGLYDKARKRPVSRQKYQELATSLNVNPSAIDAIGSFYSEKKNAWAYPMRNANGTVIGIRLRSHYGKKWAITGSKAGLFFDVHFKPEGTVYIVEGPTDAIAMYDLGLWAIGRPSCLGQETMIKFLLKRIKVRECVIIADNDQEKDQGAKFPGQSGSEKLAKVLDAKTKIIVPKYKDMREWIKNGMHKEALESLEQNHVWK